MFRLRYYSELIRINDKLSKMNRKLDGIIKHYEVIFDAISHPVQFGNEEQRILSLPKHLQSAFLALNSLGTASASMVADITGKARAVESSYLNQLVTRGDVFKKRDGRKVLFTVKAITIGGSGKVAAHVETKTH